MAKRQEVASIPPGARFETFQRYALIQVPGSNWTNAYGISPQVDIVGSYGQGPRIRLEPGGEFSTLDYPGP